jgi:hypothetical protein
MKTFTCVKVARDGADAGTAAPAGTWPSGARRPGGISDTGGATSAPPSVTFSDTGPAIPPPGVPEAPVDEPPLPHAARAVDIIRAIIRYIAFRILPTGVLMVLSSSCNVRSVVFLRSTHFAVHNVAVRVPTGK